MTPARWALAVALAVTVCTRIVVPFYDVFQAGFVSFQETDAWFHVRVMEDLLRHFPVRMQFDPLSGFPEPQRVDTGPFFDYIGVLPALLFPDSLHVIAASYPAVLGLLLIVAVFFLGRELFDEFSGGAAALIAATIPGYFVKLTSLGFTDHHVMESLLSVLFLYFFTRKQPIAAGLTLAAYLLTFIGGAILVAVVCLWLVCSYEPSTMIKSFAIALIAVAPFYATLWMNYTIAALLGGLVAAIAARYLSRKLWFAAMAAAMLIGAIVFRDSLPILQFLLPSATGAAAGVSELQRLTLTTAWRELGVVSVLAVAGLAVIAKPAPSLFFLWALVTLILTWTQMRMLYYFAPLAAILTAHFCASKMHKNVAYIALVAVFLSNFGYQIYAPRPQSAVVTPDWRDALDYLRTQTPAPNPQAPEYGVMCWWDYGYWISAIANRAAFSNPTQRNASLAASFFLATDESKGLAVLEQNRLRYVIMDDRLADETYDAMLHFHSGEQPERLQTLAARLAAGGPFEHLRQVYPERGHRSVTVWEVRK